MATPLAACSFNFCRLMPRGRSCVVHAVLGDGRGCMSLVSLRKSNYMFDMHTHQIPPGCGLLGRTGPRRRPSGGFRPHARQHTCTHSDTQHRRSARLLHEQIRAHTSALHLPGRRTCAGLLCSRPSHLLPTCSPLDCRVAPRRAAVRRRHRHRSRRRERPHGCRRYRRCRRCRRAARLCAYDGRCRRQGTRA